MLKTKQLNTSDLYNAVCYAENLNEFAYKLFATKKEFGKIANWLQESTSELIERYAEIHIALEQLENDEN